MTYVISDIHGCYEQYIKMLDKIGFSDSDILYVLGDVVDYGEHPVEVLRDMCMRANIIPIMGNHEYFAMSVLKNLLVEITEENLMKHTGHLLEDVTNWQGLGGEPTLRGFGGLNKDDRQYLTEYLADFSLYEAVTVNGQKYVLTHSGVPEGATLKNLNSFDLYDYVTAERDYNKVYFSDAILVTGHTPTFAIGEEYRGRVWRGNNHIAIDTGGVFGGSFCCVCLDTHKEFYI